MIVLPVSVVISVRVVVPVGIVALFKIVVVSVRRSISVLVIIPVRIVSPVVSVIGLAILVVPSAWTELVILHLLLTLKPLFILFGIFDLLANVSFVLDLRWLLVISTVATLLHNPFFLALSNKPANSLINMLIRVDPYGHVGLFLIKPLNRHDYPTPDEPDQLVPESVVVMRPLIDVKPATTSTSSAP